MSNPENHDLTQVSLEAFEAAVQFWLNDVRPYTRGQEDLNAILEGLKQGHTYLMDHEIAVDFQRDWDPWETTIGDFMDLMEECQLLNLMDNSVCETVNAHYFYVRPVNMLAELYGALPLTFYKPGEPYNFPESHPLHGERRSEEDLTVDEEDIDTQAEVQVGPHLVQVDLMRGITPFGVALIRDGMYDEYNPSILDQDTFVVIWGEPKIDLGTAQQVCDAYLFELAASLGLEFALDSKPTFEHEELQEELRHVPHLRMRPLQVSSGLDELYRMYRQALAHPHLEFQVISFVKVIEFVSRTVVRLKANEEIRIKLLTREALSPGAKFIAELESTVLKQEKLKEDRQAIIQTVVTCCDVFELSQYAPDHLGDLKRVNARSTAEQRNAALSKFAGRAYATRNALAHAKANYKRTGEECPADQLEAFVQCLKLAAQQVIRWYGSLPEDQRIFAFEEPDL